MWKIWSVSEGFTKVVSTIFSKFVGREMGNLEMGAIAAIIIGAIQAASGLLGTLVKSGRNPDHFRALVPDRRSVLSAIVFGAFAGLFGTIWSFYTFTLGADMGIRTLLVMCSIIPGAIIGRIWWKDPLGVRQVLGILTFLVAVWAMFDFPALTVFLDLPSWALATLVITFTQPCNEAFSRAASAKLDPWVNNFWVGVSTMFFCTLALIVLWGMKEHFAFEIRSGMFVFGTVIIAFIVVAMISFKLMAYKAGGVIALKKVIMQSTYLFGAVYTGVLMSTLNVKYEWGLVGWDEELTTGKIIGPFVAIVAFLIMDAEAWNTLFGKKERKTG